MSTVQEEIAPDLPPMKVDLLNIPPGSQALTKAGRSYSKAAQELANLQRRRQEILKEYNEKYAVLAPVVQEFAVCHHRINEIIMELAQG